MIKTYMTDRIEVIIMNTYKNEYLIALQALNIYAIHTIITPVTLLLRRLRKLSYQGTFISY